jgi:hypothetical protein
MVKRALEAFGSEDLPGDEAMTWMWLACRMASSLWDFGNWELMSQWLVNRDRAPGRVSELPVGLTLRMGAHCMSASWMPWPNSSRR